MYSIKQIPQIHDFEQLSLSEMRQLLGLNSYTKEEMDKKDDLIHEQIMDDILQSTTLLKEETGFFLCISML